MGTDEGSRVSDTISGRGRSQTALDWHLEWLIVKHCGRCCWWMV